MNWFKRKNKSTTSSNKLDWGIVTTDFDNGKESIHIINSNMTKKDNNNLTKSFVINKYIHYKSQISTNRKQLFVFDLRGQNINEEESIKIEKDIREGISKFDQNSELLIEFKL